MNTFDTRRKILAAMLATPCAGVFAQATQLPSKFSLIVPNVAGGTTDILARIVASAVNKETGINVVVENIAGGNGNIAKNKVIAAPGDGSLVLLSSINTVLLDVIEKTQKMDELTPLAGVASLPMVLVGRSTLEPRNVDELLTYARAPGRKLTIAAGGTGTVPHMGAIQLQEEGGASMTFVPYKGAPNMLTDLMGGHIDLAVLLLPAAMNNIRGGTVRAYGLYSSTRSAMAPDIPCLVESASLRSMRLMSDFWNGVFVSRKTPAALSGAMANMFMKVLAGAEVQRQIAESGSAPMTIAGSELTKLIRADREVFQRTAGNKRFDT